MASLERRSGRYRIVFRFGGQKFTRSLKTQSPTEAQASLARLEDNLRRLDLGILTLPSGADVSVFLLSDGRAVAKPTAPVVRTVEQLCEQYFLSLPTGSLEQSTIDCMQTHVRHLKRILGKSLLLESLSLSDLQGYVGSRAAEAGLRGRNVSATTIKKDLATFATIWSWGVHAGVLHRPFPKRGLKYPKTAEKPRFQTWAEIQRRIDRGGLTDAEKADLWDCLFLTLSDIGDLLGYVQDHARQPFVYPMFCVAAHTGARRSELIRSRIDDIDLAAQIMTIHERKRDHHRHTTRQVPISPFLAEVLKTWLDRHPGGSYVFCQATDVPHSTEIGVLSIRYFLRMASLSGAETVLRT